MFFSDKIKFSIYFNTGHIFHRKQYMNPAIERSHENVKFYGIFLELSNNECIFKSQKRFFYSIKM